MNLANCLEAIASNIREKGAAEVRIPMGLSCSDYPGLEALFGSLTVASPTNRRVPARMVEDWNPLGQRLLMSDETPPDLTELERPLGSLIARAQTLVEWAHEAVHIWSLEPWLCGQLRFDAAQQFRHWYLAGEGLAYWYADIVVTRAVRVAAPTVNLVFSRQAVSSAAFHPETAFAQLGLHMAEELRSVYIHAFCGSWEYAGSAALAQTFSERVQDFYGDSAGTLGNLYVVLAAAQVLDMYWQRFCAIPNLPSLLPPDGQSWQDMSAQQAHELLGGTLLAALDGTPSAALDRVRLRRSLQLRAYHLWMLRYALSQDQIYGPTADRIATAITAVSTLLDAAEAALHELAGGRPIDQIEAAIRKLNERADGILSTELAGAITAYRYWIFPAFPVTGGLMGLWTERSAYTDAEARAVAIDVFERCHRTEETIGLMNALLQAQRASDQAEKVRLFNLFMLHPDVRRCWSIELADIDFQTNKFREIGFEFR